MTEDFLSELNPAQFEAASAPGGPVLVLAGAGSGKTKTLVYRIAPYSEVEFIHLKSSPLLLPTKLPKKCVKELSNFTWV